MITTNTRSVTEVANVLNWGIYTSDNSKAYQEEQRKERARAREVIRRLSTELHVDQAAEEKEKEKQAKTTEKMNNALMSVFCNVPMPKEETPTVMEDEITDAEKEFPLNTAMAKGFSDAFSLKQSTEPGVSKMRIAADEVYRMLEEQRTMSLNARRGLSPEEAEMLSEFGVTGKIMPLSARQSYAEAMDRFNMINDLAAMINLRNTIIGNYGDFLNLNKA